jgi:hypothetical protein
VADRLVRDFGGILSTRAGQHLKDWVISARAENLPGLRSFAPVWRRTWTPSSRPGHPLELRSRRRPGQPHQNGQAPDVRPRQTPAPPQTDASHGRLVTGLLSL